MKTAAWFFDNIEKIMAVAITSVMTVVLFLQVVSRYVFNLSISWSEELSIFLMIWLTYFGASIAVRKRQHLRITMLTDLLPRGATKIVDVAANLIFLGFMALIAYGTFNMLTLAKRTHQTAAATGLPRWVIILGILVAYLLTIIRIIQDTTRYFREGKDR